MPYLSASDAAAAPVKHRYGNQVEEWTQIDNRFEAPFTVPFAWANRQVLMRVDNASGCYELWINNRCVGRNNDPHTPADFVVTKYVKEGRNRVEIRLDETDPMRAIESWRTAPATPHIGTVTLFSPPTMGVRDVVLNCRYADEQRQVVLGEVAVAIKSYALNDRSVRLYYELLDPTGGEAATGFGDLALRMRGEDTIRFVVRVPDSLLWSDQRPQHYTLRLRTQREGRNEAYHALKLGMRVVEVVDGRLWINGRECTLPLTPCPVDVRPEQLVEMHRNGGRLIRLPAAATARAEEICTVCDTLGIYVIAPSAIDSSAAGEVRTQGGNPSNDPAWRPTYLERTANSYHTIKRHPSVVGFSLADRSSNGICLYDSYLNLKRCEAHRPILYFDHAGEWNHDLVKR